MSVQDCYPYMLEAICVHLIVQGTDDQQGFTAIQRHNLKLLVLAMSSELLET